jgi:hypothetical protein
MSFKSNELVFLREVRVSVSDCQFQSANNIPDWAIIGLITAFPGPSSSQGSSAVFSTGSVLYFKRTALWPSDLLSLLV